MKNKLYRLKLALKTRHFCRKYHIKREKGLIIESGFKVFDKTKVILGPFVHICKNCVFAGGGIIQVGEHTTIFRNSEIHSLKGSCITIGNNCLIAKEAYIINSNHSFKREELIRKQEPTFSDIFIGDDVWIGGRVMILKGSKIENGCVIGAGSIVNKTISEYSVAAGIPCKVIKKRD